MVAEAIKQHEGYLVYIPDEMWALIDESSELSMIYYYNGWPSNWKESSPVQGIDEIVDQTDVSRPLVDPRGLKWKDIGELVPEAIGPQAINDPNQIPAGIHDFKVGASGAVVIPLDKAMCLQGHELSLSKLYYLANFAELERVQYGFRVYSLSWKLQRYLLLASRDGKLVIVIRARRCFRKRNKIGIVMPSQEIIAFTYLPRE
jgi:hypothetical protein